MPDARREVIAETLTRPGGHYSHAVVGAGLVFVAGQLAVTPDGTRLTDASFAAQAQQTLANVATALTAAGSGIEKLLSVRVYLTDIDDWTEFNTLYAAWAGSVSTPTVAPHLPATPSPRPPARPASSRSGRQW